MKLETAFHPSSLRVGPKADPPVVPEPLYRPAAIAAQRAWALRVFGRVW